MKNYIVIAGKIVLALGVAFVITNSSVSAQSSIEQGVQAARGDGVPTVFMGDGGIVTTVTNFMLFVVGALSVIMLIWGGLRYTLSGGNSASVTAAKNTIMYAIIGLIIAFLAFALVNFVLGTLAPTTNNSGGAGFTNV